MDIQKIKSSKTIKQLLEFSIINIDKPTGPTSFTVSQFVKKELGLSKTSHLGTLDPQVTGVLLCGLGKATRLMEYMLKSNKEYVCLAFFHKEITKEQILEKIEKKEIPENDAKTVMQKLSQGISIEKATEKSDIDLKSEALKIIKEKPGLSQGAYMGLLMGKFKGQVSGKEIADALKELI